MCPAKTQLSLLLINVKNNPLKKPSITISIRLQVNATENETFWCNCKAKQCFSLCPLVYAFWVECNHLIFSFVYISIFNKIIILKIINNQLSLSPLLNELPMPLKWSRKNSIWNLNDLTNPFHFECISGSVSVDWGQIYLLFCHRCCSKGLHVWGSAWGLCFWHSLARRASTNVMGRDGK